jgi:hypothetical protein
MKQMKNIVSASEKKKNPHEIIMEIRAGVEGKKPQYLPRTCQDVQNFGLKGCHFLCR